MKIQTESLQIDHGHDEADAAPALDPRPVFDGDWATASGLERGQHADRIRQWKLRQGLIKPNGQAVKETGSVAGDEERDRSLALRTARAIARDADARDADRLTAASLLARIEEAVQAGKPPSVQALHALDEGELEALVLAHL